MLGALATIGFNVLDIRETASVFGHTFDWQWLTLGSFVLFLGFVAWWIVGLEIRKRQSENAKPNIRTELETSKKRFNLLVRNIGGRGGLFTATGRVVVGKLDYGLYVLYWEGSGEKCLINGEGGIASILVAEKAPFSVFKDMESSIYEGELSLFMMGVAGWQPFPVHSYIEKPVEVNGKEGVEIIGEDRCTLEITITSDPPLLEAFGTHRYTLEIDPADRDRLLFTEVLASDTGDSQTE